MMANQMAASAGSYYYHQQNANQALASGLNKVLRSFDPRIHLLQWIKTIVFLSKLSGDEKEDEEFEIGDFLKGDDVKEAGDHADEVGVVTGVVDRQGAKDRRKENQKDVDTVEGLDRDEYPPAVIKPDNPDMVSVKPINRSHNRRSGGRLRGELPADGTKVKIIPPGL